MKSIKEDLCVFLLRLKNGVQRALKQNELALRSQLLEERGVQGSFYVVFCFVFGCLTFLPTITQHVLK